MEIIYKTFRSEIKYDLEKLEIKILFPQELKLDMIEFYSDVLEAFCKYEGPELIKYNFPLECIDYTNFEYDKRWKIDTSKINLEGINLIKK